MSEKEPFLAQKGGKIHRVSVTVVGLYLTSQMSIPTINQCTYSERHTHIKHSAEISLKKSVFESYSMKNK